MNTRLFGVILVFALICLPASADEVDDLIAASDAVVGHFDSEEAEALSEYFVNGALIFGTSNPLLAIRDNDAAEANLKAFFESLDFYSYAITDRVARVFGNTGLTAATVAITIQNKGESVRRAARFRQLTTWSKVDGKWKIVGGHRSWFPSGQPPF